MGYYRPNLATIHHLGFGGHADRVAPGLITRLAAHREGTILELGCGSGALTRHLVDAGFAVIGTDASPAMLDLAIETVPGADFQVLTLPDDPIPPADAIVAVGHPLNYLDDVEAVRRTLDNCVGSLRPGGVLIVDLCDLSYGSARSGDTSNAIVEEDWAIFTRFSTPDPNTFVREMTTFLRQEDGSWERDDETHRNVLLDVKDLADDLLGKGMDASVEAAFGEETLPEGLLVLHVVKPGVG